MESACKEALDQLYFSSSGRFPRTPIDGYTIDRLGGAASRSNRLTYTSAPDVALSSFPTWVQELVTDAAIPSIPQFWRLMRHIQMDEAFGRCPEFVDMIFDHLIELPPAPGILEGKEWHRVEVVSLVFYGLYSLTRPDFAHLYSENSPVKPKFSSSWPSIWGWMEYLYYRTPSGLDRTFDAQTRRLTDVRIQTMNNIGRVICNFSFWKSNPIWQTMKATPGLFLLIAEIWMRQQDLPDNNERYKTDCVNLSSTLSHFFRPDDMSTTHILIDAMAGDLSKFATAMAKAIYNAAYGGPHWMVTYPCLTSIRGTLSLHSARFSNMLISMNIMEDVCHILDVYGSPPESPEPQNQPSPSAPRDWLIVSLSSITQGSKGTDGFTWVIRAIKSKLIVSLLKCACWLSADLDRHTCLMLKFLGPYLVYRSVLRALGQAVQSPEIPTPIERVPRNGTFWEEWLEFSDKLRSLMESKLEFDQAGKYRQECASPGCDAVENGSEIFRLCGGCQRAFYCSKQCQQRDWKEGQHRQSCEEIRQRRLDGAKIPISARDTAFFVFILNNAMDSHREGIVEKRDMLLSDSFNLPPSAHLQIHFDLKSPRSMINVHAIGSTDATDYLPAYPTMVKTAKLPYPPGKMPVFETVVEVPYGDISYKFPVHSKRTGELFGWIDDTRVNVEGLSQAPSAWDGPEARREPSILEYFQEVRVDRSQTETGTSALDDAGANIEPPVLEYQTNCDDGGGGDAVNAHPA